MQREENTVFHIHSSKKDLTNQIREDNKLAEKAWERVKTKD